MDSQTQFISILIILFTLATSLILIQSTRRRRRVGLRAIPAFEVLPALVGEAIEADRPLHLSFGGTTLGGPTTVLSLVTAELFYQIARRTATGVVSPIITTSEAINLPLAQDTLRRAYAARARLELYDTNSIRWYPSGEQSLAFAAAVSATLGTDKVGSNVLGGSFGSEMALILEAAQRRDVTSIATSSRLEGQAVAYAMAEYPLLGEELFASAAYLEGNASQVAGVITFDALRYIWIILIIIPTINALTNNALYGFFTQLFASLTGGG